MAIEKGNKVTVEYIGTLEDGTEFDSSAKHGQPLSFEVGAGQMIKGFDEAVVGMNVGEEKDIVLEPKDAYGDPQPELRKEIPREHLPKEPTPEVGMMLGMQMPDGKQFPAKIVEVNETNVVIDLNHPLAGKKLKFHVKVVSVE